MAYDGDSWLYALSAKLGAMILLVSKLLPLILGYNGGWFRLAIYWWMTPLAGYCRTMPTSLAARGVFPASLGRARENKSRAAKRVVVQHYPARAGHRLLSPQDFHFDCCKCSIRNFGHHFRKQWFAETRNWEFEMLNQVSNSCQRMKLVLSQTLARAIFIVITCYEHS